MKNEVQVCTRCIMDDSADDYITFNEDGECNYCTNALKWAKLNWFPNEIGEKKLHEMIATIKAKNKDKKYDCIMGISGGLDSSYLLYLGHKWGLRVLCVHIDDGYDTEISAQNIQKLINKTGYDYEVITPDAEQFNALSLAFMKSGVPNLATPQDNLIFSYIYKRMLTLKVNTFLSGGNFSLESILQKGNTHTVYDMSHLKDIHKKYNKKAISKLHFMSEYKRYFIHEFLKIKTLRPLNFVDYRRKKALKELNNFCGFEYYGSKHLENEFTAFVQLCWFPQKFNVDKRKSHLSSMIISNQITREEALKKMQEPLFEQSMMNEYINKIIHNFGITKDEFEAIMKQEAHQHTEYKISNATLWIGRINRVRRLLRKIKSRLLFR